VARQRNSAVHCFGVGIRKERAVYPAHFRNFFEISKRCGVASGGVERVMPHFCFAKVRHPSLSTKIYLSRSGCC